MTRKTLSTMIPVLSTLVLAAGASAQPLEAYSSGLLHSRLGGATLGPPTERRLPVLNLGSSGQDGVEIKLRSLWGGTTSVDLTPFTGATGAARSLRTKYKGWDGTIKGRMQLQTSPSGAITETADFSAIGATALHWKLTDDAGNMLAEGVSSGPVLDWGLIIPPGVAAHKSFVASGSETAMRSAGQGFFDIAVAVTGLTSGTVTGVRGIEVVPVPCAGCVPGWGDVDSMQVTATGVPSFELSDSALYSFSWGSNNSGSWNYGSGGSGRLQLYGLGGGHIDEACDPGTTCGLQARRLVVSNIGSSGQDGVAIDLGGGAGGMEMRHKKGGHVTLIKAFDDETGQEMSRMTEGPSPATGGEEATFENLSPLGGPIEVHCFDPNGNEIASQFFAGGVATIAWWHMCPPGSYLTRIFVNGHWMYKCEQIMGLVLPGGQVVDNVASFSFGASNPGHLRRVEMYSDSAGETMVIDDLARIEPQGAPCDPDLNQDGNVDQDDVAYLINVVGGGNNSSGIDPDFNHDGNVDQDDVLALINVIAGAGCP